MTNLTNRTIFMSGGSRGIGLAIAVAAARKGANVVIAAKTDQPHPKLPGTIHTAVDEIRAAGGRALGVVCDIRDEAQVAEAVGKAADEFGGIDIVINNASAIQLTPTLATPPKRYDLMTGINSRGTYVVTQACLDHLVLAAEGVTDFDQYSVTPDAKLQLDFFFPHDTPEPADANGAIGWRAPQLKGADIEAPEAK